ncbi:glycoside hydrolase family 5 protein [Yoonia sp. 2307UL14-13]|uniref:glycoside hydrolase family 5 protein n=1 Tax=Yoonia sp. 2307UL14-13 TaxID=3126506 RepID=UPI0030AB4B97
MRLLILLFLLFVRPAFADHAFPVQRCVNLDQALEAPNEGDWGYTITRPDIEWIAAQGFDTIRLPVRFDAHWDGQIAPSFLVRVDAVIGWAMAVDLNVILDLHHFEGIMSDPAAHAKTFTAIWSQLAGHYADHDDRLIFELLNEPQEELTTEMAVALFADILPVIRAQNPTRWVVIEGGYWSNITQLSALPRLDEHTALSFHYYGPWEFTHQQATWLDEPPPPTGWGSTAERDRVKGHIAEAGRYGLPMLLGEFGVTAETEAGARADWIKTVRQEAEAHGMGWCHWGFAGGFPIFDAGRRDWLPGIAAALMGDEN